MIWIVNKDWHLLINGIYHNKRTNNWLTQALIQKGKDNLKMTREKERKETEREGKKESRKTLIDRQR